MRKKAIQNKDSPADYNNDLLKHTLLSKKETLELIKQAQKDLKEMIKGLAAFKEEKEDIWVEVLEDHGKQDGKKKKKTKEKITNAFDYAIKYLKLSPFSRAMNKLLVHNQRFIFYVAKKRYGSLRRSAREKVDLWDLAHVGSMGFYQAVLKFSPEKNCALSTYAERWVQHEIDGYLCDKDFSALRFPVHVHERERLRYKFLYEAEEAGVPEDKPLRFFNNLTLIIIRNQFYTQDEARSMSEPAFMSGDGDTLAIEEVTADQDVVPADVRVEESGLRDILDKVIDEANLSAIEKEVICHRFGVRGFEIKTLKQLGDRSGLSRERIRQIQEKSLLKLKHAFGRKFGSQAQDDYKEECRGNAGNADRKEADYPMISLPGLHLVNGIPREMLLQVLDMPLEKAKPIITEYKEKAKAEARRKGLLKKRFKKPGKKPEKQKVAPDIMADIKVEPVIMAEEAAAPTVIEAPEKEICTIAPESPVKTKAAAKKIILFRKKAPASPVREATVRPKSAAVRKKTKRRYGRAGLPEKEINKLIALYYFLSQDIVNLIAIILEHSKPTVRKYLKRQGIKIP